MKKHKLAYVIDCASHGNFHEVINQGFLMMISNLYERVIYISDKTACDNLRENLHRCNVCLTNTVFESKTIKEIKFKPNSVSVFLSAIKIGYLNNYFYRKTEANADVFFCNFLHFTALINQIIPLRKRNRTFYMCHAEMEFIESASKRGCFAHVFKWYLRFLFNVLKINKQSKFVLLSDDMAETFKGLISPKNRDCIFGMEHCYIRPTVDLKKKKVNFEGLKIGLPGAVSPERGVENLKNLVCLIDNPNVRLYAIGTLSEHICSANLVELNTTGMRIPFDEYEEYAKQMDAFLMMYDLGSYKMTASGALLEAIWNEKPVFALRNVYFEHMFKIFGKLGVLVNSVEELASTINALTVESLEEYKKNLVAAKKLLSPSNVTKQLEGIIEN